MGGICSRSSSKVDNPFRERNGQFDRNKSDRGGYQASGKTTVTPPPVLGIKEDKLQEQKQEQLQEPKVDAFDPADDDDFYDGIPRYPRAQKSRSVRSTQAAVAKVGAASQVVYLFILI